MNYILISIFRFSLVLISLSPLVVSAVTVDITATVPGCGDYEIRDGEQCDGTNLGGSSCSSLGFGDGTLSCTSACTFNTTSCVSSPSGGEKRRIGQTSFIPVTNVVFTGNAYPGSIVSIVKDAKVMTTGITDQNGNFQMILFNIAGGDYVFSVYSEVGGGPRSLLLTFPLHVVFGLTTKVENISVVSYAVPERGSVYSDKKAEPARSSTLISVSTSTSFLVPSVLSNDVESVLTLESSANREQLLFFVFMCVLVSFFVGYFWRRFRTKRL